MKPETEAACMEVLDSYRRACEELRRAPPKERPAALHKWMEAHRLYRIACTAALGSGVDLRGAA